MALEKSLPKKKNVSVLIVRGLKIEKKLNTVLVYLLA